MSAVEQFIWSYLGIFFIIGAGGYFTVISRFFQIRKLPQIIWNFAKKCTTKHDGTRGIHPVAVFFAAVGGCIGIGNLVTVCIAVQVAGPGAVFWMWVAGLCGMLLKYCEVYLGIRYRIPNESGGYSGGPIHFVPRAFGPKIGKVAVIAICLFLCIYGTEVFMFNTVAQSFVSNWNLPDPLVRLVLLFLVFAVVAGGVRRVAIVSTIIIPSFCLVYMGIGSYVLYVHKEALPEVFASIFAGAFSLKAGLAGLVWTMYKGISAGCYSGDVGIGYESAIHSESTEARPGQQASLSIFGIFLDTFMVCTMSLLLILATGVWKENIDPSLVVQAALEANLGGMSIFMPLFIFATGYTTMTAIYCVGIKCAEHLSPRFGKTIYYIYGLLSFAFASYMETTSALSLMMLSGGLLMMINVTAILMLRNEIKFELED